MNSNQLLLFKPLEKEKLDKLVYEIEHMMYTYKHQALHIEISIGKAVPFTLTIESINILAELLPILSKESPKYRHVTPGQWKTKSKYEPYYPALEPRSAFDLSRLAKTNNNSSKACLNRFTGVFEWYGPVAQSILDRFYKNNDKTLVEFKKIYGDISEF